MIVSFLLIAMTAIIGHVMAVLAVGQAYISEGKIDCSVILRNVYFDIAIMLICYATLPTALALMMLNITTVKFSILSFLDYDYIHVNN